LVYVRHQGPLAGVELTTLGLRDTTATVRPQDEESYMIIFNGSIYSSTTRSHMITITPTFVIGTLS
jgi:hypothetical protein